MVAYLLCLGRIIASVPGEECETGQGVHDSRDVRCKMSEMKMDEMRDLNG